MTDDEKDAKKTADEKLGLRFEDLESAIKSREEGEELPPAFRFLEKYFPEKGDIGAKGRLESKNMPVNISSLRVLGDLYPELKEAENPMDETVVDWLDNLEKRLTSVEGKSREEYKEILEALLSGLRDTGKPDEKDSSIMRELFTVGGSEE